MEWDCVSEDILLVVRGEKIPVDLSVLLAPELVSFSDT